MISLLVIVCARPAFFDPALQTMTLIGSEPKASLQIGNAIAEMNKVVDFVDQFGAAHHLPQNITNDLNLCLDEILNNTISYGYEDQEPRSILVTLSLAGDLMTAEIQDDGKPYRSVENDPFGSESGPAVEAGRRLGNPFRQDIDGRGGLRAGRAVQCSEDNEEIEEGALRWRSLSSRPATSRSLRSKAASTATRPRHSANG